MMRIKTRDEDGKSNLATCGSGSFGRQYFEWWQGGVFVMGGPERTGRVAAQVDG
jgi:hypothetical protein